MSYWTLTFFSFLLRLLPLAWVCALGRCLGGMIFRLDRRHVRMTLSHLSLAFPERSEAELRAIARQVFINLGEGALEFLTYRGVSLDQCYPHVEAVRDDIPHAVMKRGKGLIFLTAHYGNWELLGILGRTIMHPYKTCAVGRDSSNPGVDRFVQEIRQTTGLKILPKSGVLKELLRALRGGEAVCFISDQIAGAEGTAVRFFGRPTLAIATPAYLSLKTGAPIVPVFIERLGAGRHRITYCEPIEPSRRGELHEDVQRMTQQGMDVTEEFIRRRPDQWFWLHKRWKSKKAKKKFQDAYRIALFSPHWIGDAAMSLPAQAALRELFPNATLAAVYPGGLDALYRGVPSCDERIAYGWTPAGFSLANRLTLIRRLRAGRYDMAVLFPNSFDSALLALAGGIRHRVGYADHGRSMLLTTGVDKKAAAGLHQSQKYHRIVEALGVVPVQPLPPFTPSSADVAWALEMLKPFNGKPVVALHPGATYGPTKRWFPERFVDLARLLVQKGITQAVFLGSEKEKAALAPYLHGQNFPFADALGKTDLGKLLALIAQADVLVCNDSGPMHLAGLVGTPAVAIFGSTDPAVTSPLGEHRIVRKPIACSPCLKRTCANNGHPFECLDRVDTEDVLAQIQTLLAAKACQ